MRAHQAGQFELAQVHHGDDGLFKLQLFTRHRVALGHPAADRGRQRGLAQSHLHGFQLRPRSRQVRTSAVKLRAAAVQRGRGDKVLARQAFIGQMGTLGLGGLGAGRFHGGLAFIHALAQVFQIEGAE